MLQAVSSHLSLKPHPTESIESSLVAKARHATPSTQVVHVMSSASTASVFSMSTKPMLAMFTGSMLAMSTEPVPTVPCTACTAKARHAA